MKEAMRLLALISMFCLMSCTNNAMIEQSSQPEASHQKGKAQNSVDYLSDSNYFIYNADWLTNDKIICLMAYMSKKEEDYNGRVVLYQPGTNEQELIYQGKQLPGVLPAGVVKGDHDQIYIYNGNGCLIVDGNYTISEFIPKPDGSNYIIPSSQGDFIFKDNRTISFFSKGNLGISTILKAPDQTKSSEAELFFDNPQWSPDAQWFAYTRNNEGNLSKMKVGLCSPALGKDFVIDYEYATNFAWAEDSKHLILINEGTINGMPLELKVFDIQTQKYISGLTSEEIKGEKNVNLSFITILDTCGTRVLLQAYVYQDGKETKPVVLVDWKTKKVQWLTPDGYWSVSATFSPDGKKAAVTGNDPKVPVDIVEIKNE